MTSNVGSQVIAEHAQQLRYVSGNDGLAHLNLVPVNSPLKYYDSKLITVTDLHAFFVLL
ncbi:unnamed protein product [Schistosoma mattheei]|uniref:Uncharacterized protein n=1 Tax=Schistosoma mattheei TaxID=31246 RepID=A0A183Q3G5_9TREM|nr:unnamed protein product [Schistosoma mattheei]